ncbi:speckle-type POZ protein-like [Planococcus citri]|uniref:speckle-type POZ protein-like n=1 Tax=Planococcus citri TaxID=170843 RepID=UPI0031F77FC3
MLNSSLQKSFYAELRTVLRQFPCLSPDSSSVQERFKCDKDTFEWRLEYELNKTSDNINIVSFYLHCDSEDDLINESGTVIAYPIMEFKHPPAYTFYCPPLTFNKNQRSCQLSSFARKQLLSYVVQDSLSLTLKLNYMRKQFTPRRQITTNGNSDTNAFENGAAASSLESSISRDLENIRINANLSDVTLSVNGKDYPSHRIILAARSSVFSALFASDLPENEKNHVVIADVEQEPFEEMLRYIYTGEMANLNEWAPELLPLADKYDLGELKKACEEILLDKLSIKSAAKLLKLADMHNAEKLKKHALQFIKDQADVYEDSQVEELRNTLATSRTEVILDMLTLFFGNQKQTIPIPVE